MKAVALGLGVSLMAVFIGVGQQNQNPPPPASGEPVLSHQTQPSEVEKAQATVLRPKLEPQITYSGPIVDLWRGENLFSTTRGTNVVRPPADDVTVDVITRRPRGIVLFAVNF